MISREKLLSFTFAAIVAFIVTFSMKMLFLDDYKREVNDANYKKAIVDVPKTQAVVKVVKEPTVKVLVAKSPIARGTPLAPDMLEWKEWPKSLLSKTYIATEDGKNLNDNLKADALIGLRAAHNVDAGVPITEAMFFKKLQVSAADKDIKVREGMRAFTLPVNQTSVANQMFFPGDIIDVYISTIKTFYRNVRVLALDDKGTVAEIEAAAAAKAAATNKEGAATGPVKKRYMPKTVTLELTPAQMGQIVPNIPPSGVILVMISDSERRAYMQEFHDQYIMQEKRKENFHEKPEVQTYSAQGSNEHMELVGPLIPSPEDPDEEQANLPNTDSVTGELMQDRHMISVIKRDKTTFIEIPGKGKVISEEEMARIEAEKNKKEKPGGAGA